MRARWVLAVPFLAVAPAAHAVIIQDMQMLASRLNISARTFDAKTFAVQTLSAAGNPCQICCEHKCSDPESIPHCDAPTVTCSEKALEGPVRELVGALNARPSPFQLIAPACTVANLLDCTGLHAAAVSCQGLQNACSGYLLFVTPYEPQLPGQGTLSESLSLGHFRFNHRDGDQLPDDEDLSSSLIGLSLGYAFRDDLFATINLPIVAHANVPGTDVATPPDAPERERTTGVSDVGFGVSWLFHPASEKCPLDAGADLQVRLSTGSKRRQTGVGTEQVGTTLRLSYPLDGGTSEGPPPAFRGFSSFGYSRVFAGNGGAWEFVPGLAWGSTASTQIHRPKDADGEQGSLGARGWGAWIALAATHYTKEQSGVSIAPYSTTTELRLGGGYLLTHYSKVGLPTRHVFALELQRRLDDHGYTSRPLSFLLTYGFDFNLR